MIFRLLLITLYITVSLGNQFSFNNIIGYPVKTQLNKLYNAPSCAYGQSTLGIITATYSFYKTIDFLNRYKRLSHRSYEPIDFIIGKNFRLQHIKLEKELMMHRASRSTSLMIFALWNIHQGIQKL